MSKQPTGKQKARVLVVDDDPIVADSLAQFLEREGLSAATCASAEEALDALREGAESGAGKGSRAFNVVISDVSMPGMDGLALLRAIGEKHPEVAVVMLTGYGAIESAVEAVRMGASDYLTKPVVDAELRIALERALRNQALMAENHTLRRQLDTRYGLDNIVGSDHRMLKIYELIEAVAPSKTTVLMNGESGTGKSLIARAIHHRSSRADKPFVELACGSIPETLLESELFGHVKGAFTGAHADKQGRFLAADGGTIFLDEINSASPAMQLKLLRVLQERKFEPVGSNETIEVDVRVVLASNHPLEDLVSKGAFRQDLYYRINVVRIDLPPLRERTSDIPHLAEHFLRIQSAELGKQLVGFTPEAMEALRRYAFPGNVRELENIVERAAVLSTKPTITVDDLAQQVLDNSTGGMLPAHARVGGGSGGGGNSGGADAPDTPWEPMPLEEALRDPEKRILLKALRANDWNRQSTADQLRINRTTLYKKMKSLGLDKLAG
ncbi:MAG: sigma-54-dependent Fis family transcriptional regulator [Phycisphaerales bacterium]|nr:MAG: sigma-54-dependent Fis family transcriptional regulator [Phycisphaerales bacterium]